MYLRRNDVMTPSSQPPVEIHDKCHLFGTHPPAPSESNEGLNRTPPSLTLKPGMCQIQIIMKTFSLARLPCLSLISETRSQLSISLHSCIYVRRPIESSLHYVHLFVCIYVTAPSCMKIVS